MRQAQRPRRARRYAGRSTEQCRLDVKPVFIVRHFRDTAGKIGLRTFVCTENLIRVDEVMESPKLAE
jgi:hypothetical protein